VIFPHTSQTREWVPRLAASLDAGLVTDCTALQIEERKLIATKPVYGGGAIGEFEIRGNLKLATMRSGAIEPAAEGTCMDIVRLDVAADDDGRVEFIDHAAAESAAGPKLKDAKVIIAGGRGIGGAQNWHYIDEAASALGAAVGCSRPVADSGWVPSMHQVGLSGTCVSPDLYIAVAISGAVQHLAGICAAKTVVAINTDPDADILARADYAVVGDYRDVLPAFVERVKQLRA
jgi:electron transfer flavoprotein alpha subunit